MPNSALKDLDAIFPELVGALTKQDTEHPEPIESMQWFRKCLEYNVPFGKKNRGVSVVTTYQHIVKKPIDEDLHIARVLGWCVELFQAYFLVTDDIMDNSETRRGVPCWYKKEEVGLIAVNDGLLLEASIYRLLKTYIRGKPYYRDILELFLHAGFQTAIGQCLDTITAAPGSPVDLTEYTMDRHSAIIKWKTAFYSFYLPVAAAMYMAGISDARSHDNARKILLKMGHYFQVQDDYLDCYGDPQLIGKIGTDIQDNKCSWLVVRALELASKEQKQILKDNYGRWDDACVAKVKKVYNDLDIQGSYRSFEETIYQELVALTSSASGDLPKEVFMDYANRLYKRDK